MQELSAIQDYFISLLSSETAKNIFQQRGYFDSAKSINHDLDFSKEVLEYCTEFAPIPFYDTSDIRERITFSKKDYVLDTEDIYHCHLYLSQWKELKNYEIPSEEYPTLKDFIDELFIENRLLNYWERAFDTDGNIADTASTELSRIRGMKKNIRKQIEKILNSQLHKNEDLAEKRIAFREDRYVLPLKSSAKNRHKGIVHGFSSTGNVAYIEPQEIVPLNNELLSVDDLEQQEILRLLKEWSKLIAENLDDILLIVDRSAHLEIYFTKYHFAKKLTAKFGTLNDNNEITLSEVYNPFLLIKKDRSQVVPITIEIESSFFGMIISGPNAGGKSAALKTLAICADMFLKGLPIPAQECSFPLFSEILIEIGDSQNLSNDLSTFSGHIHNIKNIIKQCTPSSLILIDEIAHATDPLEGEALACAIIDELVKKQSFFAITTHYKQVKYKSFENPQIKSYAAGFDAKKMIALYTLYPHTIGESYALNIAAKMGLPQHIVKNSFDYLHQKQDKTEIILSNVEQYEKDLRQKEQRLLEREQKNHLESQRLQSERDKLNDLSTKLKADGLAKADKELSYCLRELSHIQKNTPKSPQEYTKKLNQAQKLINQKKQELTNLSRPQKTHINIGDTVFIASLDKDAIVEEINKNNVSVVVGRIKYFVEKSDIFESTTKNTTTTIKAKHQLHTEVKNAVDLHGMTVEEAIAETEKYLFAAYGAGLYEFSITHGKGTGILQKAITRYLNSLPEVKKHHFADPREGGSGKTIVYFNERG